MSKSLAAGRALVGVTGAFSGRFSHPGSSEQRVRKRRQEGARVLEKFC